MPASMLSSGSTASTRCSSRRGSAKIIFPELDWSGWAVKCTGAAIGRRQVTTAPATWRPAGPDTR